MTFTYPEGTLKSSVWANVSLPDENGCMRWLGHFHPKGYGSLRWPGRRTVYANRAVLILTEGQPPEQKMDAAHTCRHKWCVAPTHNRWATRSQNEADKVRDGVSNRGERNAHARLTRHQVLEIRDRYIAGETNMTHLAASYGVDRMQVHRVVSGKTWVWLTGGSDVRG